MEQINTLPAWALANTASAYATILAGILCLLFCALMRLQPKRWIFFYVCIVITGMATVWHHGFGETYVPRLADIGANLLSAWVLQVAVLGDFYAPSVRRRVATASATVNSLAIVWMIIAGPSDSLIYIVRWGEFGEYYLGESLLILDAFLVVGLIYAKRSAIPARARPLLHLVTGTFFAGLLFATASNSQVHFRILAYHAAWHIVSAFGFIALWAFNHVRFERTTRGFQ